VIGVLEVLALDDRVSFPDVTGDEYVPLMIRWGMSPAVVWQAVWPDGRVCCEMMIARVGGRVADVTLLNPPAVSVESAGCSTGWVEDGVPVVSLEPFEPNPDLVPQLKLVKVQCSPTAALVGGWLEIRLDESEPLRWATSGTVGFGIDVADRLVAIRVLEAGLPRSGSLAAS
jgi:hypothetical protein